MKQSQLLLLFLLAIMLAACDANAARYNNEGNENFKEAAYEDAIEEYNAAKEENPDLAEPYYNSGNTFHRQGELKQAMAQTQQALRLADDELAQQAFYNLGNSYFLTEDWPAAIKAYQEALLLNPNDADAKHNLELALENLQQQQQAQQGEPQQGEGGEPGEGTPQPNGNGEPPGENPSQGEEEEEEEGAGNGEEEQEEQGEGELSEDEAEQLLDSLSQESQTLQERLNQTYGQGRRPLPQFDW